MNRISYNVPWDFIDVIDFNGHLKPMGCGHHFTDGGIRPREF